MAFSMNDTTARDQESGYLKNVEGPKVALAADEDLIETDPGTVVDFSLTVTNLGPMQDVFTLSATTDEARYEWQFFDVSGNPIGEISVPSGQQRNFTLRVVVPADAKPGEVAFTVKATSQHNAAAFDTETVTLSVGEVINLTIEPNRSGSVNQGGYTTYTLAVWNRGNTDKNITLGTMVPSGGEKRLFYVFVDVDTNAVLGETQSFTVPAGSSQNVKIRVDAPSQISVGTTEVVNVVLKITGSDTILDYATLTTTVTGWELDLNKDVTVGPEGAKPGSQLTYTIKATNISVKGLTEVKVFEKIPAHTTFVSAGGPEGVAIDYVYAEDGVTVTDVTWEIGDMAPDAVVTLTLTVQIQ